MKLLHCSECHHEWHEKEGTPCDWCGAPSYVLEDRKSSNWLEVTLKKMIEQKEGNNVKNE